MTNNRHVQDIPEFSDVFSRVPSAEYHNVDAVKEGLTDIIAMLRAMQLWFHAAHHTVRGTSFIGDHVNLYSMLYEEISDEVDAAIEKGIGHQGDESIACPIQITSGALEILLAYPSPASIPPVSIAATGLELVRSYNMLVESVFRNLEDARSLPLGLNDFLAASANKNDKYVYLLQQRVKTELET